MKTNDKTLIEAKVCPGCGKPMMLHIAGRVVVAACPPCGYAEHPTTGVVTFFVGGITVGGAR